MRLRDALSSIKSQKSAVTGVQRLRTVWSEPLNPDHVLEEYPRPQFRRKDWICLNGIWEYAFTRDKTRPLMPDGQILVPFSPESRLSGVEKRLEPGRYLWYFRHLVFQEIPEKKRLLLHFGAVDESCGVWWNGNFLGSHQGGYLPFSFDVTDCLHTGRNTLFLRVRDDTDAGEQSRGKQTLHPSGMFYPAQSGIWQTVWMEWVPENYVEGVKITPLFDQEMVRMEFTLTRPERMKVWITGQSDSLCCYVDPSEFPDGGCQVTREIPLPEFHPWSPDDPFLYEVQIQAGEDCVESYFAMRKFSVGRDGQGIPRLMLNNQPYFFNGVLDQGYWPESLYTPPSDEAMIFDIQKMKELGFNTLRKHLKVEPLRWYYHCDRLGMVVWQDMVNGGGKPFLPFVCYLPTALPFVTNKISDRMYRLFSRSGKKLRKQWERECMDTVAHLYNCPCIGLWTPFNEGWGQFDALRITEKIRKADATRPIDHASGWYDQGGGDIKSVHNYFRPLKVKPEQRPFVLSEYGGASCPVSGHTCTDKVYGYRACRSSEEFTSTFLAQQQKIRELEKKGLAGAVYTQVSDVEEEMNGLYTYDRKVCKVVRDPLNTVTP